jgi:hypothetical protein
MLDNLAGLVLMELQVRQVILGLQGLVLRPVGPELWELSSQAMQETPET